MAAVSTTPLSYQWMRNGVAITGAVLASYTTNATATSDSGTPYSVIINSTNGTVTSAPALLTVTVGPVAPSISVQPVNVSIIAGQSATFIVAAGGTTPLSYLWQKNGTVINGATAASYTTTAAAISDNGAQFSVVVSNSSGSATSSGAILSVTAAPVAPSISTQPASQTTTAGQTATFFVTAAGTAPLNYQWQKNGAAISGATSATYTTPSTGTADNGGQYIVSVSNAAGSASSNAATLTVNSAPSIAGQPSNQSVTAGQTATFSVTAAGTAPFTYQWKKNGAAITGATSASYTTAVTAVSDSGAQFSAVVTNSVGSVSSSAATLTVTSASVAPSITGQPANQSVTAGQTATFSVTAAGTAPLAYQWMKNGAAIGGATAANYTTPATQTADNAAQFSVAVSNTAGSATSSAATLTVSAAPVTPPVTPGCVSSNVSTWTNIALSVPQTSTFHMEFDATPSAALLDSVVGVSAAPAGAYTDLAAIIRFSVAGVIEAMNATAYQAAVVIPYSAGVNYHFALDINVSTHTYSVSVIPAGGSQIVIGTAYAFRSTQAAVTSLSNIGSLNSLGTTSICNVVTTNPVIPQGTAPTITAAPVSQTVAAGQTSTFSVTAGGTAPFSYQWQRNGATITGATSASYSTPATAVSDNGAQFAVVVTNSIGNVLSTAATLTVTAPPVAPSITSQPTSQTVTTGQAASFSVTAAGTSPLGYQWKKNGTSISGATAASYTTPATAGADSGAQFTVTVSNSAGSVTSAAATLTVNAVAGALTVSTSALSFGSVSSGSTSTLGVTFTNSGSSSITIANVTISGPGFTATGVSAGLILSPGQAVLLSVSFTPAATGNMTGSATVASNAANSPVSISLSGTGAQPITHSVTLNWTASTSSVAGYNVYRSAVSGGPYTIVNSSLITTTQFTDSTVQAGQTYYYVVTSVDSTGVNSSYSNEVSATIP